MLASLGWVVKELTNEEIEGEEAVEGERGRGGGGVRELMSRRWYRGVLGGGRRPEVEGLELEVLGEGDIELEEGVKERDLEDVGVDPRLLFLFILVMNVGIGLQMVLLGRFVATPAEGRRCETANN
jgi:hypothetical protein